MRRDREALWRLWVCCARMRLRMRRWMLKLRRMRGEGRWWEEKWRLSLGLRDERLKRGDCRQLCGVGGGMDVWSHMSGVYL